MAHVEYRLRELMAHHSLSAEDVIYQVRKRTGVKIRYATLLSMRDGTLKRIPQDLLAGLCLFFRTLDPAFRLEDLIVCQADPLPPDPVS